MMVANAQVQSRRDGDQGADRSQPPLELRVESLLDPGRKRKDKPNEDSLFIAQDIAYPASVPVKPFALFVVADGMGGLGDGRVASQLAIASLVSYVYASLRWKQITPDTLLPLLMEGVQQANARVYRRNQERGTRMGTTMTAALVSGTTAYVANVGDSRTYFYRSSAGLFQITHDHSMVAALVEAGAIKPDDIYTHPWRNQIYRCLGEKPVVTIDTFVQPLTAGDTLLLCSDGLWEMVHDPYIADILATSPVDPSQAAHALVEAALASGGEDNVAVIVVQVRKN